jgi:maleate cis-trans isomerase
MRKKPLRRPVKKPGLKRQRLAQHKKRLLAAGVTEEKLVHMNTKEIRAAIRENRA